MPTPFVFLILCSTPAPVAPTAAAPIDYTRDVKPILTARCVSCHGGLKSESGLRLDHGSFVKKGGDGGPIVLDDTRSESPMLKRVHAADDLPRMPPEGAPLSTAEIAVLERWIETGAATPADEPKPEDPGRHWAFQPLTRPAVPIADDSDWNRNPIDAFLAAGHRRAGVVPAPTADKSVFLRRVYLDLIGIPPTPKQQCAYLEDAGPNADERVVDELLARPEYGQRWGRHWMDVWRYSDWAGFGAEIRESQPHVWRWRDWIIESLNKDAPYDHMVRCMIAGDEIAPDDPGAVAATGFLVRNWSRYSRNGWLKSTVEHTSKAFLGVTIHCAQCHDHMYDPITQKEYYQFRAFFEPHEVRTDSIRGELDVTKDGLVRVYDADAAKPTYLFDRGDDAKPVKTESLAPGVPAA
ncbi:MAG: DUF1549 domain-containing protein, partial [Planctomycetia bacterium]